METVPNELWDKISHFQRIFLIYGSPLEKDVLRKAQIHRADKAVILGFDPSLTKVSSSEVNDEMLDA